MNAAAISATGITQFSPGSRTYAFDPAPPEAPAEHPVAQDRDPADVLVTEAWDWIRPVEAIGDGERALPHVVGLGNTAFLAAAGRLTMALSEPVHELNPVFDPKIPGSWKCDFSTAALDLRLPNPFTRTACRRPAPPGTPLPSSPTPANSASTWHRPRVGCGTSPGRGSTRGTSACVPSPPWSGSACR
ncbi:hypothetical protein [Streptomyces sp. NRRL B-24484]|uniref:hypothetical protein n=1 Tax=Streptomyces sp. NRRL B-24484 TaxID=1463833 RepID=UPI000694AF33|nr:hypothetical protein [Streptomyces sp. NRRL B-24484]